MRSLLVVLVAVLLPVAGCASPSERAEAVAIEKNPVRDARTGELCRYRAVRDGSATEKPVVEDWIFRVLSASAGSARVEVSVLGPPRVPPSPSPREPSFAIDFPMTDGAFSAVQLIRLFHRPELTTRGANVVLDREAKKVEGHVRPGLLVVQGKTREVRELSIELSGGALARGSYRAVIADDLPVLGIIEAELDETWTIGGPDGDVTEERRHDRLRLLDSHEALDAR